MTPVRLRPHQQSDPRCARSVVEAVPGRVRLPAGEVEVARVRLDDGTRRGRIGLLDASGRTRAVLDVDDWVPGPVRLLGIARGEDPTAFTGAAALADAVGVPLERGAVEGRPLLPCRAPLATRLGTLLVWLGAAALVLAVAVGDLLPDGWRLWAAGLAAVGAVVLQVEDARRARDARRLPEGRVVVPVPSVPVSRRFLRDARLVLRPDALLVRGCADRLSWYDVGTGPTALERAEVVTPPGADRPERVDLYDGLGRAVVRLPWAEWFGADDAGLAVLAQALRVDRVEAASLGEATWLLGPTSERHPGEAFAVPGSLGADTMAWLAALVTVVPVGLALAADAGTGVLLLGLLNGALLLGPVVVDLLRRPGLDTPRPAAPQVRVPR